MTAATPEIVVSGVPYVVIDVNGHPPQDVHDFTGAAEFTLGGRTGRHTVVGEGSATEAAVRFHEKAGAGGKDVRVWNVYRDDDGAFIAAAD